MKNKLVKIVIIFICFFTVSSSTVFAASEAVISVEGPQSIKKGEKIEYKISIKDVNRLYAGSIDIKFNNDNIIYKQIKASDFIKKEGVDKMEFGGNPNSDNNKISYQFTCVGKTDGFSGEGVIATVIAEGVKDCEINFDDSLVIKLCERTVSNDIVDLKYGYGKTDVMSEMNSEKVIEKAKDITLSGKVSNSTGEGGTSEDSDKDSGTVTSKERSDSRDNDISKSTESDDTLGTVGGNGTKTTEESATDKNTEKEEDNSGILVFVGLGLVLVVTGTVVYLKIWKKRK